MSEYINHQFNLFPQERPKTKIPISAERIREAKAALERRDAKGVLAGLRYINDRLEAYERRLSNGKENERP